MNSQKERFVSEKWKREIWHKIVLNANKNILFRVVVIGFLAVFLFCRHIKRYLCADPRKKMVCVFSSLFLFFYAIGNQAAVVVRGEENDLQEEIKEDTQQENALYEDVLQASVELVVTEPEEDIIEGYTVPPVYRVQITNNGSVSLSKFLLKSQIADVFMLYKEVEVPVYHPEPHDEEDSGAEELNSEELNSESKELSSEGLNSESEEPGSEELNSESEEPGSEGLNSESEEPGSEGLNSESEEPGSEGLNSESEEPGSEGLNSESEEPGSEGLNSESEEPGSEGLNSESEEPDGEGLNADLESGDSINMEQLLADLPTILEPGQVLHYSIQMPLELPAGEYTELLSFGAAELENPVELLLNIKIGENESSLDTSESVNSEYVADLSEPESQLQESETHTDEIENKSSEEEDLKFDTFAPLLEVLSYGSGYYMGVAYFVTSVSDFVINVSNTHVLSNGSIIYSSPVKSVFCEINSEARELELKDGKASVALPESYDGFMKFYAVDEAGNRSEEIVEYIVSERNAPTVDYAKVISSTDGLEQIRITIKDSGEVISGLREVECFVDGQQYTDYVFEVFEKVLLPGGKEIPSGMSFDIPLMDQEVHTVEVCGTDHTGNFFDKVFRVCASKNDVVSVVLPTSFGMEIFPTAVNGNIFGEDIVIANQSDFPVEVVLAAANVCIDHSLPENRIVTSEIAVDNNVDQPLDLSGICNTLTKDAALNLNLKEKNNAESAYKLLEGTNSDVVRFTLEQRNPNTDAALLQKEQSGEPVLSGDYAIVNLRGVISEGSEYMWKDGDITVSLTFTFRKLEDFE